MVVHLWDLGFSQQDCRQFRLPGILCRVTGWAVLDILDKHDAYPYRAKWSKQEGLYHRWRICLDTIRNNKDIKNAKFLWDLKILPYILESNPHPNLIRTSFCRFLKRKKTLVRGSNPHLSFNRPLPTTQADWIILDTTNTLTVIWLTRRVWSSDWVTGNDSVMSDDGESDE